MRSTQTTSSSITKRLTNAAFTLPATALGRLVRRRTSAPIASVDGDDQPVTRDTTELAGFEIVDDPDGTMRLIGVSGVGDLTAIAEIYAAIHDAPCPSVHIDLASVVVWLPDVLDALEDVLDDAEMLGYRLRVTGLDPRLLMLPTHIQL